MLRRLLAALLALPLLALTGCASESEDDMSITVFAAASLHGTFTEIGKQFEAANPGTKVTFIFGGSSSLASQINSGSPADVFASASTVNMDQVVSQGNADSPQLFASNTMQIATLPTNPGNVTSLADVARPEVTVAICQEQVPCGTATVRVFANAKLAVTPVTLEPDVTSVLTKVKLKSVDAGVVYVTDVQAAADSIRGVVIPAEVNAVTQYPIAVTKGSQNNQTATGFLNFVLSAQGKAVMSAAGFAAP